MAVSEQRRRLDDPTGIFLSDRALSSDGLRLGGYSITVQIRQYDEPPEVRNDEPETVERSGGLYCDRLVSADGTLADVLTANTAAGLPAIDVSPPQGKLLHLIARMISARFVLEIGTLGGYSTIWLARALPEGGKVVTLEVEPEHARVARTNFARTGVGDRVDLRLGPALEMLPRLAAEGIGPFDLVFIDADKPNNPDYLQWAVRMARSGAVIIGDNMVREGTVLDAHSADLSVRGIRRFCDLLAEHPRLSATAIQTVGSKGWDGFALAVLD